MDQGNKEA
jgi:hypothetical protein